MLDLAVYYSVVDGRSLIFTEMANLSDAAKDAFARVYASIRENGIVDIGLQAAVTI